MSYFIIVSFVIALIMISITLGYWFISFSKTGSTKYSFLSYFPFEINAFRRNSKDKYLNLAYYPGMTKHKVTLTDKMYAHLSTIAKGRKHINKNGIHKMCKLEDLNYYLNNGWKLGRK